jgi:hypothetical protein
VVISASIAGSGSWRKMDADGKDIFIAVMKMQDFLPILSNCFRNQYQ